MLDTTVVTMHQYSKSINIYLLRLIDSNKLRTIFQTISLCTLSPTFVGRNYLGLPVMSLNGRQPTPEIFQAFLGTTQTIEPRAILTLALKLQK